MLGLFAPIGIGAAHDIAVRSREDGEPPRRTTDQPHRGVRIEEMLEHIGADGQIEPVPLAARALERIGGLFEVDRVELDARVSFRYERGERRLVEPDRAEMSEECPQFVAHAAPEVGNGLEFILRHDGCGEAVDMVLVHAGGGDPLGCPIVSGLGFARPRDGLGDISGFDLVGTHTSAYRPRGRRPPSREAHDLRIMSRRGARMPEMTREMQAENGAEAPPESDSRGQATPAPCSAQSGSTGGGVHRADRAGLVEVLRVRCDHLARRLAEQGRPEDASGLNHACTRLTGPGSSAWRYDADGQPSLVVEDPAAVGRPVVAATPEDARRVADTLPMPNGPPPIVVVDGVSPPWLLGEIVRRTGPESHVSHGSGIVVIAPDWEQVVVALSHDEAVDWLGDPRVVLFAGDRAPDAFRAWLDARSAYLTSGATIGTAGSLSPNAASILQQLSRELRRKSREDVQLREKVLARDRARGPAYWAERYRGAINPISGRDASPLRVLVITTRYSTYMRHSAAGLAGVLNDAGYAATLLIEPDRHTKLSSVTYLRAIDEIDPDLIITINYQRRRVGDFIPGGIPYITWTQDAMPNLFDRAAPVAGSVRDFIVGHLERSMFMGSGDAAGRALCVPVLASESEFHPGPVAPDEARQQSCEVAWVSNHGVPPDQLSRDLLVRSNIPDERRRAIEAIGRELQGSITRSALPDRVAFLRSARDRFTSAGFSPAESGQLIISYALPLAERVLRHQTARWAKDICERRGWRMRVFGSGGHRLASSNTSPRER